MNRTRIALSNPASLANHRLCASSSPANQKSMICSRRASLGSDAEEAASAMRFTWGGIARDTSFVPALPGSRPDQLELPHIDRVRAKAALAVGQIHLPHAAETL